MINKIFSNTVLLVEGTIIGILGLLMLFQVFPVINFVTGITGDSFSDLYSGMDALSSAISGIQSFYSIFEFSFLIIIVLLISYGVRFFFSGEHESWMMPMFIIQIICFLLSLLVSNEVSSITSSYFSIFSYGVDLSSLSSIVIMSLLIALTETIVGAFAARCLYKEIVSGKNDSNSVSSTGTIPQTEQNGEANDTIRRIMETRNGSVFSSLNSFTAKESDDCKASDMVESSTDAMDPRINKTESEEIHFTGQGTEKDDLLLQAAEVKSEQLSEEKGSHAKYFIIGGVVFACIIAVVINNYYRKDSVDFFDACTITFTGVNGSGEVVGYCDSGSGDQMMDELLDSAYFYTMNEGTLSNGDTVDVYVGYDEMIAENQDISVVSKSENFTVSGLMDINEMYSTYDELPESLREQIESDDNGNISQYLQDSFYTTIEKVERIGIFYQKPYVRSDDSVSSGILYVLYRGDENQNTVSKGDVYATEYYVLEIPEVYYVGEDIDISEDSYECNVNHLSYYSHANHLGYYTTSNEAIEIFSSVIMDVEQVDAQGDDTQGIYETRNLNQYYYAAYNVNIREQPSEQANKVGKVYKDDEVLVTAIRDMENGDEWGQLENGYWICLTKDNAHYMIHDLDHDW